MNLRTNSQSLWIRFSHGTSVILLAEKICQTIMNIPDVAFTLPIQVRFIDTDQAGHVNHATFITYLEAARVEWIKAEAESGMANVPIIIARVEMDYKRPIGLYSKPEVSVWISRIGTKSFDMEYVIYERKNDQDIVYATAKTVVVYFNYESQESETIPELTRTMLKSYQP